MTKEDFERAKDLFDRKAYLDDIYKAAHYFLETKHPNRAEMRIDFETNEWMQENFGLEKECADQICEVIMQKARIELEQIQKELDEL